MTKSGFLLTTGALPLALIAGALHPVPPRKVPVTRAQEEPPSALSLWGFSRASASRQMKTEASLAAIPDPESARRHLAILTEEPHMAGTARDYELAEYVRDRWKEYGLEDVEIVRYEVLLPYAREASLRMVEPVEFVASMREEGYPEDKDSYDASVGIPFHSFSASAEVTAHVVYSGSGNPEDYDRLASLGIDVRGKIVLVRYSVPYSYRGFKALTAQQRGAAGILIYSDPADDGYMKGETYPQGPWGPESHIQRGAITFDFMIPGDPLTPGYPSTPGARRIPKGDSPAIPKIASLPLSYRDAGPILKNLAGPVAPRGWQGGLPFTYHVGPGPAKVELKVVADEAVRPIWNVIGRIKGSAEPDNLVILGNHRDAWVYGAVDPASGTAAQLELASALGSLARSGLRPRRTIVFASWDAEEFSLTGSTEWGEQRAEELAAGAVAYLNVDSAVSGPEFSASAVPSLNRVILQVARDVTDPGTGKTLLDAWKEQLATGRSEATTGAMTARGEGLVENRLGSGSDYTVFLNFLGVPIAHFSFNGPYGVYHSIYDSFTWMSRFGDPSFRYHVAMAEIWGRLTLRLANADFLPFDYSAYASSLESFLAEMEKKAAAKEIDLDLNRARQAAVKLGEVASRVNRLIDEPGGLDHEPVNRILMQVERALLHPEGIPGRSWFKHLVYAPKFTYAPEVLPGIAEALDAGDAARAREQTARLAAALERAGSILEQIVSERPEAR